MGMRMKRGARRRAALAVRNGSRALLARWALLAHWSLAALCVFPGTALAERPEALAGAFRAAEGSREWRFPRDHGSHEDYRLEWWYYTGLLTAEDGGRIGFQVTFFRRAVLPGPVRRASAWAPRSLFAAQAALSLLGEGRFMREGLAARGSLGMAGAATDRQEVWLGAWRAEALPGDPHGVRLHVPGREFALDLELRAEREPVLHGVDGLDRKGEARGNASWYYSLTRLAAKGRVTVDGKARAVRGMAWMDHEFGTTQLAAENAGWDWMGLRLSDGSDLMLYRLRRKDGAPSPHSAGTWVDPNGRSVAFTLAPGSGNRLTPLRWWQSPATGARYPIAWRIELPELDVELTVEPLLEAQELAPTPGIPFAYWEGAVSVKGRRGRRAVRGEGYLELTGYGGSLDPVLR